MKGFFGQIIIAIVAIAVALCAANECEFNEDLSEISKSNSTNSLIHFKSESFVYNALDEKFEEDFECYDDIVPDISDRDGMFELSCASSPHTLAPKKLKNYKKQIREVINNPYFEQKISYVKCLEKNTMCEHGENSPPGFAYVCRQKYVKMTLKVIDAASGKMIDDQFPIPSYCACEYVRRKA